MVKKFLFSMQWKINTPSIMINLEASFKIINPNRKFIIGAGLTDTDALLASIGHILRRMSGIITLFSIGFS